MASSTVVRIQEAGERARRLCGGQFREQTAEARAWLADCCETVADGRQVRLLGAVDVWFFVARSYDGGIEGFLADGGFEVVR